MNRILFYPLLATLTLISPVNSEARNRKHDNPFIDTINNSMVKPPQDQEVCFSPNERCDIKLTKFVESAKGSIDVAIYDINLDQLVHQLSI